jgi:hypothetical protein
MADEDSRSVLIVRPSEILSLGSLAARGWLFGAVLSGFAYLAERAGVFFSQSFQFFIVVLSAIVLIVFVLAPFTLVSCYKPHVSGGSRPVVVGFAYGLGLYSAPMLGIVFEHTSDPPNLYMVGLYLRVFGVIVLISALVTSVAGAVVRRLPPRVVVQDGALCPGCAYCLIGNESMVCPECGRPFTFEELGTTEEAFRARLNASGATP